MGVGEGINGAGLLGNVDSSNNTGRLILLLNIKSIIFISLIKTMASKNLWSKEELMLAFNLYLKIPFGKMHSRNPDIIHLANTIGRTANSIALRLVNFAAIDPYHKERGVKGMAGGAKQCQPIWDEFIQNKEGLIFESEKILATRENQTIETKYKDILRDLTNFKGEEKIREVKTRVNQSVFRQIVVGNYSSRCAITGIDIPELLLASHIVPWSKNENERLNPENGICLSALYDRAFDKGLIGITPSYEIILSTDLKKKHKENYYSKHFEGLDKKKIVLPERYLPKKEFLEYHLDEVFGKRNN